MALDIETTNFPNGISSYGALTFGVGGILPFGGKYFWVDETNGSDGNSGAANRPFATIDAAYAQMRDGYNDVCFFSGSVHLGATLAWSKSKTHLVGLCAPTKRGKRARLSPATTLAGTAGFNKLVEVSGQGCMFANFQAFYGFSNTAAALIAWSEIGGRNSYDNVEFLGFGDGTAGTGTANLTGARALKIAADEGEVTFRNCVFGVDTTTRNVTNYTVEIAPDTVSGVGTPRIYFENCDFEAYLGASGDASSHLLVGAGGIDRYVKFINTRFGNEVSAGATVMAQVFNVVLAAGGAVRLYDSAFYGATAWQTAPTANVQMNMTAPSANGGKAITVA